MAVRLKAPHTEALPVHHRHPVHTAPATRQATEAAHRRHLRHAHQASTEAVRAEASAEAAAAEQHVAVHPAAQEDRNRFKTEQQ
jgi:hypothetical protein